MKSFFIIALLLVCDIINAQSIFSNERMIDAAIEFNDEEIVFFNQKDALWLSGTLLSPKTNYKKIVIIVPGSGKDTRHSHYKLTQEFLQHNIAVFRFDERGTGASQGNYTTNVSALTDDLIYGIKHLKSSINFKDKKIGIVGHSLGGVSAVKSYEYLSQSAINIDFLIQIATPSKNFSEVSRYQISTLPSYKIKNSTTQKTLSLFDALIGIIKNPENKDFNTIELHEKGLEIIKKNGFNINDIKFWSIAHINLFKDDYESIYKSIKIPTLYIIGSKDTFVNPIKEVYHLKEYKNPLIKIKVMENLNHYLTSEALTINTMYHIDLKATKEIMNWIKSI